MYSAANPTQQGDFLIERAGSDAALDNFGTWHVTEARANGWGSDTGSHEQIDMDGGVDFKDVSPMAQMTGFDNGGGGGFYVQYHRCM